MSHRLSASTPAPTVPGLKPKPKKLILADPSPRLTLAHPPKIAPLLPGALFQGVGIIQGDVSLQEGRAVIAIADKSYPLYWLPTKRRIFDGLLKQVARRGSRQRLVVYPFIRHLPTNEPHQIGFNLVGVVRDGGVGLSDQLQDFEFILSGLWQFIPPCRLPCVSIFKNFSSDRLARIKTVSALSKVRFLKASHIPLLWKDAPVPPFRFNPRVGEQAPPHFVQITARFLPERDLFGFSSSRALPSLEAPKFLKAGKKDKEEARNSG